jgi:hypothetical protein
MSTHTHTLTHTRSHTHLHTHTHIHTYTYTHSYRANGCMILVPAGNTFAPAVTLPIDSPLANRPGMVHYSVELGCSVV